MCATPRQLFKSSFIVFLGAKRGRFGHANTHISMAKDMTRVTGSKNAALLLGSKQAFEFNPVVSRRFTEETVGVCELMVTQRV